jgi:dienelactone hydrolase
MVPNFPSSADNFEELVAQFEEDPTAPLEAETAGKERRDGVSIQDVSFTGTEGQRVQAYWVIPEREGPIPGVVYVHPAPGDRTTFLEEAVLLGKQGVASLVVEAPWAQGEVFGPQLAEPGVAREAFTRVVKDLRRAVDFLVSRPEIDASRVAYVGHSFGALVGGVLAGVEKRIRASVLMAGTGSFMDIVALNMPFLEGPALEHYAQVIAPIDPVHYVPHAAPSALFFQFGRQDDFTQDQFERVAQAASEPKFVKWYDTDHYFQIEEAQKDRLDWLQTRLSK